MKYISRILLYRFWFKTVVIILTMASSNYSEILYWFVPPTNKAWSAATVYMGPSMFVEDSLKDVFVSNKISSASYYLGSLSFMVPIKQDSSKFLFHNLHNLFPQESTTINIGRFPQGTPIVFRYIVEDTSHRIAAYQGKKNYSGQNRIGVDYYISEKGSTNFGKKWVVGGRIIDSGKVEMGFSDGSGLAYRNIQFSVSNVYLEGLEKNKVPQPIINPSNDTILDSIHLSFTIPVEGLYNAITTITIDTTYDTIRPVSGATLKIFFTLDGTPPTTQSQQYFSPIPLYQSTTVNAFAVIVGDTNWFASEVVNKVYIKKTPTSALIARSNSGNFTKVFNHKPVSVMVYSIAGKKIGTFNGRLGTDGPAVDQAQIVLPSGIYYLYAKNENVDKKAGRRVVWNRR